tara:strand:- start:9397 stop:9633 length:237 start_codon:yes stop_codon:yes gene_type:complete
MIPTKVLAQATANAVVSVALDRQHRKLSITFKDSKVTLDCGWSGDDIVMKVRKVRGMVEGMGVVVPKKKIILPPGVKG